MKDKKIEVEVFNHTKTFPAVNGPVDVEFVGLSFVYNNSKHLTSGDTLIFNVTVFGSGGYFIVVKVINPNHLQINDQWVFFDSCLEARSYVENLKVNHSGIVMDLESAVLWERINNE